MNLYVRTAGLDALRSADRDRELLFFGESCQVTAAHLGPGADDGAAQTHPVDRALYVLAGEVHGELGAETFTATPDTLVFVPAGTPLRTWNPGTASAFALELLAPGPAPDGAGPAADVGGVEPFVQPIADRGGWDAIEPGYDRTMFLRNPNVMLYLAELAEGGAGPDWHVHQHDQFYYVLEGELAAEIGLDSATLAPHQMAVLPAGVPHRVWNASAATERHLVINAPVPPLPPGRTRGDIPVRFEEVDRPA